MELPIMWRFVELHDATVSNLKLSCVVDDLFQVHLWNYAVDEFKKTNQNLLARHTSSVSDGALHLSSGFRLGLMAVVRSDNLGMGINVEDEDGRKRLKEMIDIVNGDYA